MFVCCSFLHLLYMASWSLFLHPRGVNTPSCRNNSSDSRQRFGKQLADVIHTETWLFLHGCHHACCSCCTSAALPAFFPAELELNTKHFNKYRCLHVKLDHFHLSFFTSWFTWSLLSHTSWASMLFLQSDLKAHEHTNVGWTALSGALQCSLSLYLVFKQEVRWNRSECFILSHWEKKWWV